MLKEVGDDHIIHAYTVSPRQRQALNARGVRPEKISGYNSKADVDGGLTSLEPQRRLLQPLMVASNLQQVRPKQFSTISCLLALHCSLNIDSHTKFFGYLSRLYTPTCCIDL